MTQLNRYQEWEPKIRDYLRQVEVDWISIADILRYGIGLTTEECTAGARTRAGLLMHRKFSRTWEADRQMIHGVRALGYRRRKPTKRW